MAVQCQEAQIEQPEYVEKDQDWLALNAKIAPGLTEVAGNPLVHAPRRILCLAKSEEDDTTYCLTIFDPPDDKT